MMFFYHKDILGMFPDLSPRTLISWVEKGLITPYFDVDSRGGKRVYSLRNLIEIAFVLDMQRYGISFRGIKFLMEEGEPVPFKDLVLNMKKGYTYLNHPSNYGSKIAVSAYRLRELVAKKVHPRLGEK